MTPHLGSSMQSAGACIRGVFCLNSHADVSSQWLNNLARLCFGCVGMSKFRPCGKVLGSGFAFAGHPSRAELQINQLADLNVAF